MLVVVCLVVSTSTADCLRDFSSKWSVICKAHLLDCNCFIWFWLCGVEQETQLLLTGRAQHHISPSSRTWLEINAYIGRLTIVHVIDFVHYAVFLRYRHLWYLKWPPKDTQGHGQCCPSLDHLDLLSETGKVGYTYFQTKIAAMTLKVDQDCWRWHTSVGYISLCISCLVCNSHMSILYRF